MQCLKRTGAPRGLPVRRPTTKTSSKELDDGDFPESDKDTVQEDNPLDGDPARYTVPSLQAEDAVSLVKHLRVIEKQLAQLKAFLPESAKSQLGFQDKVAAGPASTTSSINGDHPEYFADDNIARLAAVVGDASHHAFPCISRLLLHFYSRLSDSEAHEEVDEVVEIVLGVFADIQAHLMFPPDADATVVQSVKTPVRLHGAHIGGISLDFR